MSKIISNKTWVKYVYNQRINNSISGGYKTTKNLLIILNIINIYVKNIFIQITSTFFTYIISTTIKPLFNLLNKSFTHNPQNLLIELLN